jgi:hypothetical protein
VFSGLIQGSQLVILFDLDPENEMIGMQRRRAVGQDPQARRLFVQPIEDHADPVADPDNVEGSRTEKY